MNERKTMERKERRNKEKKKEKAAFLEESLTSHKDQSMLTKSPRSHPVAF